MSQAETTNITSRRRFLAGAAVAAVVPAAAVAGAPRASDVELLELGKQLDEFVQREKTATDKWIPHWEDDETPEPDWEHPDDVESEAESVMRAILATPATTIDGLAVKARLAVFGAWHMWAGSDEDAEWDHLVVRNFIDSFQRLAAAATVLADRVTA
ncbi:hypothetical protein [Bradyrhizobium sp. USDA 3256]